MLLKISLEALGVLGGDPRPCGHSPHREGASVDVLLEQIPVHQALPTAKGILFGRYEPGHCRNVIEIRFHADFESLGQDSSRLIFVDGTDKFGYLSTDIFPIRKVHRYRTARTRMCAKDVESIPLPDTRVRESLEAIFLVYLRVVLLARVSV